MYYSNDDQYQRQEPSVLTRWTKLVVRAALKGGKDFCKETSIHGFNHIAAPRRHWFERLLWVAATMLAIWGALDVSMGQLQRFNESPTVVTLEKDFRSWRYSLPAITYCYKNRVDKAKLPSTIKQHFGIERDDASYPFYSRLVTAIANSDLFHLELFQEFRDMDEKVDMVKIASEVMLPAQIKTVSSEGGHVYKWIPVITEAGACYATNSLALADVTVTRMHPNDSREWPISCKYSSLSCYIIMDVTTDANFYVHSPYDIMDLTLTVSDVFLSLTRATQLSVMESRCGRGVKELQPKRRGCLYSDEPIASGKKVYSTNTCRLTCRSRLALAKCGCIPFYYFYEAGPQCTPKGMWCLAAYAQQLTTNNGEKCACAPQCMDSIYKEISVNDQIWDRLPFKLRGSVKFIVQAPKTRYTREIVFHFQDLVVSFGGAAGLFLGASFISFVEILFFLLTRAFRLFAGDKPLRTEEKKPAIQVKKLYIPYETQRIKHLTSILDGQRQYEDYIVKLK
ncbi:pickpocket protein 28-like [Trichoplusia ni]|uniref:Pickpocket protein 28-like n=1 Tax=Trichoplusia ni TaxID=7111 RepID=A0A7E5VAX5_TRINI|nr:pickpocket protein 28-like [Trichoplusia ni]